jgi:hypothetical protein
MLVVFYSTLSSVLARLVATLALFLPRIAIEENPFR